jgi:hypothetical protein
MSHQNHFGTDYRSGHNDNITSDDTDATPTKPTIPEHLMKVLRERLGLENDDASKDYLITSRRHIDNLRELSAWEFGDPSWADWFAKKMEELGVKEIKELTTIW